MTYAPSDTGSAGTDAGLEFLMNPSKTLGRNSDANPYHPPLGVLTEDPFNEREGGSAEDDESFQDDDGSAEDSRGNEDEDDDDDGDGDGDGDDGSEQDNDFPERPDTSFPQESPRRKPPPKQQPPPPPPPRPSFAGGYKIPPGATVEDIKRDLLYQFDRLEKKGYKLHRRFSMASNVDDMRQEYDRLLKDKKIDAAVRFQQTCLMGIVSGLELMNKRFDPFDLKLDGWSDNVHGKLNDFDDTFEELAVKYSNDKQMAPELKLLLSVVGSAFMFHITKKVSDVMPGMGEIFNENPDIQRQVAGAAANMMSRDGAGGSGLGGIANMLSGMFNQFPSGGGGPPAPTNPAQHQPMRGPHGAQQRAQYPPPSPPAPQTRQAPQAPQPRQPQQTRQTPQTQQAPQARSSAADVLNFMRTTNQSALLSEDNVEIISQSDTSEISEVVSLSGRKPRGKKRTTLDL
eukprot:jgi/Tetstr1/447201/TSEL_034638.t1